MGITLYTDYLSQPCRAVAVFLAINKIKFTDRHVDVMSGATNSPDFLSINPFHKVPVIDEDNFVLVESEAILKFLAGKKEIPNHWYPTSPRHRAKVDEFISWHHNGLRAKASDHLSEAVRNPVFRKIKSDPALVEATREAFEAALSTIEDYFLQENEYLTGDDITIADLLCCMEVNTIGFAIYDWEETHPKMAAYMARVAERLNPYYDEYNKAISQLSAKLVGRGKAEQSKQQVNGSAAAEETVPQSKAEEPKAEEPKAEEPKAEDTKREEPLGEEPKEAEPKAAEAKVDESEVKTEVPVSESEVATTAEGAGDSSLRETSPSPAPQAEVPSEKVAVENLYEVPDEPQNRISFTSEAPEEAKKEQHEASATEPEKPTESAQGEDTYENIPEANPGSESLPSANVGKEEESQPEASRSTKEESANSEDMQYDDIEPQSEKKVEESKGESGENTKEQPEAPEEPVYEAIN